MFFEVTTLQSFARGLASHFQHLKALDDRLAANGLVLVMAAEFIYICLTWIMFNQLGAVDDGIHLLVNVLDFKMGLIGFLFWVHSVVTEVVRVRFLVREAEVNVLLVGIVRAVLIPPGWMELPDRSILHLD